MTLQLMIDLPERPTALWFHMGQLLFCTQTLEWLLSHYVALMLHKSREEGIQLLEKSLRKTLGRIVRTMQESVIIPDGFRDRLDQFVDNRNWLAHRLFAENCHDIYDEAKFAALLARLERIQAEARSLPREFIDLCERWCLAHGVSREEHAQRVHRYTREKHIWAVSPAGERSIRLPDRTETHT